MPTDANSSTPKIADVMAAVIPECDIITLGMKVMNPRLEPTKANTTRFRQLT